MIKLSCSSVDDVDQINRQIDALENLDRTSTAVMNELGYGVDRINIESVTTIAKSVKAKAVTRKSNLEEFNRLDSNLVSKLKELGVEREVRTDENGNRVQGWKWTAKTSEQVRKIDSAFEEFQKGIQNNSDLLVFVSSEHKNLPLAIVRMRAELSSQITKLEEREKIELLDSQWDQLVEQYQRELGIKILPQTTRSDRMKSLFTEEARMKNIDRAKRFLEYVNRGNLTNDIRGRAVDAIQFGDPLSLYLSVRVMETVSRRDFEGPENVAFRTDPSESPRPLVPSIDFDEAQQVTIVVTDFTSTSDQKLAEALLALPLASSERNLARVARANRLNQLLALINTGAENRVAFETEMKLSQKVSALEKLVSVLASIDANKIPPGLKYRITPKTVDTSDWFASYQVSNNSGEISICATDSESEMQKKLNRTFDRLRK